MSVANHDYWQAYIRDMADRMALKDWCVTLTHLAPDNEDAAAQTKTTYGRKRADISLMREWETNTPEQQRQYLTHEVIHLHVDVLLCMGEDDLEPLIGKAAQELWQAVYRRQLEYAVDGLADAIAPLMPLPEVPKDKK